MVNAVKHSIMGEYSLSKKSTHGSRKTSIRKGVEIKEIKAETAGKNTYVATDQ